MSDTLVASYAGPVFPGLRPFRPEETVLFFGREEHTDELLRRFEDGRFLATVGLSGSGKSSLVLAGLIPALHRGHLGGSGSRWRTAVMRPGLDPLGSVVRALDNELGGSADRGTLLRSDRLGLLHASRQGREADENLLVVVDQFEEIFRFRRDNRERSYEAAEFVRLVLAATQEYEPDYRVYVVLTMRSDYLGDCAIFTGLPEALNESQYLVPRLNREQMREAIAGPAALGGVEIAPDLLEELLDKATGQQDQLPVLQHLLMRMWRVRTTGILTRNEYDHPSIGGWENALNRHADQVYRALPEGRQVIAKRIFQRLTESGKEDRESRRPAQLRELGAVTGTSDTEIAGIVEHFRKDDCNFLTSPDSELQGESVIDVIHETLIRRWDELKKWAAEEAESGEWYQRVDDRLGTQGSLTDNELLVAVKAKNDGGWNAAWAERYFTLKSGFRRSYEDVIRFLDESRKASERRSREENERLESERRKSRRNRAFVALTVAFACLAAVAGYSTYTVNQASKQAERNAQEASRLRDQAQDQQKVAEQQRKVAQVQQAIAEKAVALAAVRQRELEQAIEEASRQRDEARRQAAVAESEKSRADNARKTAEEQRIFAENQRGIAERAVALATQRQKELEKANVQENEQRRLSEERLAALKQVRESAASPPRTATDSALYADSLKIVATRLRPLRPGLSIGSTGAAVTAGSICCFVRDVAGKTYALTMNHSLGQKAGLSVTQPSVVDGGSPLSDVIGTSVLPETGLDKVGLIELRSDAGYSLDLPVAGRQRGMAEARLGEEIFLFGRGSGLKTGTILALNVDVYVNDGRGGAQLHGMITTSTISSPGDSGAPVFNRDGALLGALWGGSNNVSVVLPIRPVLQRLKLQLITEPAVK